MLSNRKTNPNVRDGRVQKKNWDGLTHNYYNHDEPELVIDRRRPGPGAKHFLSNDHIRRFVSLIPDWRESSRDLRAIVLAPYSHRWYGRYNTAGVIKISAWQREMWCEVPLEIFERDRSLYELVSVQHEQVEAGILLKPDERQIVACQLLGTFLHELGHHVDRISSRNQADSHNGEPYAETFEAEWRNRLWPAYCRKFTD